MSLSGIARLGSCVLLAPQQIYLAWGDRKSCLWKQKLSETNRCVGMTRRRAWRFERSLRNVEFSLVRPRCEDRGSRKFTITAASDDDDQNRLMFCLFWYKTKLKVFILASISYRLYSWLISSRRPVVYFVNVIWMIDRVNRMGNSWVYRVRNFEQ